MTSEQTQPTHLSYDELLKENLALRQEIEILKAQYPHTWSSFAETSRKLQVYSASIKAAVSSPLNYDIFWDHANEHEFLVTIDSSVNQVSDLMALLTLAFRAQANSLVLSRDLHLLQEILSVSQTYALRKFPKLRLSISFPPEGKPVLVDYEYLSKGLQMLYEVFYERDPLRSIQVVALEYEHRWIWISPGSMRKSFKLSSKCTRAIPSRPPAIIYPPKTSCGCSWSVKSYIFTKSPSKP